MDEKYKNMGETEDHVIEECSELIQAICKAKRFGLFNYNPYESQIKYNIDKIKDEIKDVLIRIKQYQEELQKIDYIKEPLPFIEVNQDV